MKKDPMHIKPTPPPKKWHEEASRSITVLCLKMLFNFKIRIRIQDRKNKVKLT